MTEKEIFDLVRTYNYGKDISKNSIPQFSDTGKLYPGSDLALYYKSSDKEIDLLYNFYDFSSPYVELNKRRTGECLISLSMLILDQHIITDDAYESYSNILCQKNFRDVPVSKINKEKLITILEQNKNVIKNLHTIIKKYKIAEGF